MVRKGEIRVKCAIKKVQNNKMCKKQYDVQKTIRCAKKMCKKKNNKMCKKTIRCTKKKKQCTGT